MIKPQLACKVCASFFVWLQRKERPGNIIFNTFVTINGHKSGNKSFASSFLNILARDCSCWLRPTLQFNSVHIRYSVELHFLQDRTIFRLAKPASGKMKNLHQKHFYNGNFKFLIRKLRTLNWYRITNKVMENCRWKTLRRAPALAHSQQ